MPNTSHKNSAFYLLHSLAIYRCSNEKLAGVRIKGFTTLESQLQGWKWGGVWQPRSEESEWSNPSWSAEGPFLCFSLWVYLSSLLEELEEDTLRRSGSSSNHSKLSPFFGVCKRKTYSFDPSLLSHRIPSGNS